MNWNDIQKLVPTTGQAADFIACLEAFPALHFAKDTPQGEYHREGDVWTHTMMVVDEMLALAEYRQASRTEQEILFLAALLHDVAKHSTTVIDPVTGKIGQPGHSRKGAIDTRIALWDAGTPFEVREAICNLIRVHQVPFFALDGSVRSKTPEFIVRELSCQMSVPLLAALAEADMRGRICDDKQKVLDNIERFRDLARDEGCYGTPRAFADAHTKVSYFRGANVHPDYPLYQNLGSRVIAMSGLQAAGKDTWVQENHPDLAVVSFDHMRAALKLRYGQNEGKVAHAVVDRAKDLLRRKEPFVWNATNVSELARKKCLDLLYDYNAEVQLVYLEKPRRELLRRNSLRDTSLANKRIEGMLYRWDMPLPTEAHSVEYVVT